MLTLVALYASQQDVTLRPGLVITESARVRRGEYTFPNKFDNATTGAIIIKGDNITVDFNGVVLRGSPETTQPDARVGTGVFVTGKNVTVRNLKVHGYKLGLVAVDAPGFKLLDSDFSYNWKQRLGSTLEREDSGDWMSYHQNEKDEWLRYGAGIYLRRCEKFEIKGCSALGGQNGLMMTECNEGLVWNNDFSFLSSLGIGMYRSSRNMVMHNSIDWCVRGYSHGVYNRGQDSAGILIYEQSNDNVFAYNSVTHGGDGFFLWAGQTTMDTGQGGCNGNLLFGNDFSHAPTNGIEATFSKNAFVNNLMLECWHGIWAGYSFETKVIANTFGLNAEAIAWEHGQDNQILYNTFDKDRMAINLWQKDSEDPNWGYSKNRDTRSRNNTVAYNTFRDIAGPVVRLSRSTGFSFTNNTVQRTTEIFRTEKELDGIVVSGNKFSIPFRLPLPVNGENEHMVDGAHMPASTAMTGSGNLAPEKEPEGDAYLAQFQVGWRPFVANEDTGNAARDIARVYAPQPLPGGKNPFLKPTDLRGRRYILVDEWGPYDFKSPLLWLRKTAHVPARFVDDGRGNRVQQPARIELHFEVLGAKGEWRLSQTRGVEAASASSGQVPGKMFVRIDPAKAGDVMVQLTYTGGESTDYRGVKTAAGRPVTLRYQKFVAPIDWNVSWFSYDPTAEDPRTSERWRTIIAGPKAHTMQTKELNFAWGGSPIQGMSADYFLTLAEGSFTIPDGEYEIEVTSDDGVRVYLDNKVILNDWTYHAPKTESVPVRLGGRHKLRVEHFELNGYSALKVVIKRK